MLDFGIALLVMVAVVGPLMVWVIRADRRRRRAEDEALQIRKEKVV